MKRVLVVAFHFPPFGVGSGVHRALKIVRYLPEYGWAPSVLTAHPRAYPFATADRIAEIPPEVEVERAFAMDSARHLALKGSYFRWTALPDRWCTWWFGAVVSGLKLIREHRPDVLWSTYPIATAHWIGHTLHKLSGIPWVADFRDPMTEGDYPPDPLTRRICRRLERAVARGATRLAFTTPSTRAMYLDRFPSLAPERCLVIPNGFDEEDFADLVTGPAAPREAGGPMRLLHSGVLYPEERDPRPFFMALARLKAKGSISAASVRVDLRASGSEALYAGMLRELGIDDIVHPLGPIPYREALRECAAADGLLIFQAASCDHQIPAKAYEYLRLRKPILALTTRDGDTAALLREAGGATLVELDDEKAIVEALPAFLRTVREGTHPLPSVETVGRYSRRQQTGDLAACFSEITAP